MNKFKYISILSLVCVIGISVYVNNIHTKHNILLANSNKYTKTIKDYSLIQKSDNSIPVYFIKMQVNGINTLQQISEQEYDSLKKHEPIKVVPKFNNSVIDGYTIAS